jgi:hypothetical protein
MQSALVCAKSESLRQNLRDELAEHGYEAELVRTPEEAIAILKQGPRDAMITEMRRDAFAYLLQVTHELHPAMPVQLIDGLQVFCFYPLSRQPADLIHAIKGAGVGISPFLLRHAVLLGAQPPTPASPVFVV